MSLTSKLEALSYICFAGFLISAIVGLSYPTFELLIITITICVIFFVVLISNIYFGLRDKSLETRKLPWWYNIGVSMMALGILLYSYPELGIMAIFTGLIIILCATYYREHRNYDKVEPESEEVE
jgi:O-antigen/teichoic acid export membrane protein